MQVVLVYLQRVRRNSLLKCVSQPEIAKKSLKSLILGSRSFKVIDGGTTAKPVSNVGGTPLSCPRSRRIASPSGMKFAHKKLETPRYHKNPESLISPGLDSVPGRDTRTDRQTYIPVP